MERPRPDDDVQRLISIWRNDPFRQVGKLEDELSTSGTGALKIDSRIMALIADLHLETNQCISISSFGIESKYALWGGNLKKEGKSESGDNIFADDQLLIELDGVTPANIDNSIFGSWKESTDTFASIIALQAIRNVFNNFSGNPDKLDLIAGLKKEIPDLTKKEREAYGIPSSVPDLAVSGAIVSNKNPSTPILYLIGDIRCVGIKTDGSLHLFQDSNHSRMINETDDLDRNFGALRNVLIQKKCDNTDELLRQYLNETYELKASSDREKMKLIPITTDRDRLERMFGDGKNVYSEIIDQDIVAIILASDGMAENIQELPFWALLPKIQFSRNIELRRFVEDESILKSLLLSRQVYELNPGNLQRERGVADDDASFVSKIMIPLNYNYVYDHTGSRPEDYERAFIKAFMESQQKVLALMEDRKLVPGSRVWDTQIFIKIFDELKFICIDQLGLDPQTATDLSGKALISVVKEHNTNNGILKSF